MANFLQNYTNFSFSIIDHKIQINRVPNIKYLGEVLDPHLRWEIHVNYILKKVRFVSYKPHVTYGILAWGAACSSHIYNLDVFQKSILKMMFKKPKLYPTDKLYADVRMYDIRQLYFLHSITHYHKFVNTDQKIKHNHYTRYKIRNRVDDNPSTSTRDVAREVQVSRTKVWQTLREEGLYPFHVQRVQALQPDDFPARVRFCESLLHQHDNNPDFLKCIFFTDESTFTRNGVNNFRNTHVWSVENPHAVRRAHFQQIFSVNRIS
ncbi:unnamed protein product [Acanthoscelides obtectus]|uniref:Uncharacterized protein n=1 Tax=Acanthoscelides obtectus TaxID=200917 RepID=A0A9P0MJ19_ACAOB|nr:unnamed protein product [Acanthoscelides obtectus]CAK1625346.1 hypothetical protein AOBTE_LOCUS3119 [Acanthoscelides obtectus]